MADKKDNEKYIVVLDVLPAISGASPVRKYFCFDSETAYREWYNKERAKTMYAVAEGVSLDVAQGLCRRKQKVNISLEAKVEKNKELTEEEKSLRRAFGID